MKIKLLYKIFRCIISGFILLVSDDVSARAVQRLPELVSHSPQELFDRANDYLEHKHAPDSALLCLTALTSLAEAGGDISSATSQLYIIAYSAKGALHASVYGNYSEAAINFLKGLELARRAGDTKWEKRIEFNVNAMEYEQGRLMGKENIVEAMERFSGMLSAMNVRDDLDLILPSLLNVAEIGIRENKTDEPDRIFRNFAGRDSLPPTLTRLGEAVGHYNDNDFDRALESIDEAVKMLKHSHSVMQAGCNSAFYVIRAHILLGSGRQAEAIAAYDRCIEMCEQEGDLFTVFEIYRHLREYFEKKGNKALATDYLIKEYKTKDQLINRSGTLSLEGSKALYNQEKLRQEILSEVSRTRTYKTVFWISAIFLLILAGLLVMLYRKYRQLGESRNIIVRNDMEYFSPPPVPFEEHEQSEIAGCEAQLFERLKTAVKNTEEIYEEEFNTGRLARLVGEKPATVSAAIMAATGETTSQFLARTRIREACRRINDTANYGEYTIEAIGQSVGYRSRSHFGSVFKKTVGMTPSEYAAKVHRK